MVRSCFMFLVCKLLLCAGLEKRRVEYNRLQGPPTWRLGKGAKDPAWPGARRPASDTVLTAPAPATGRERAGNMSAERGVREGVRRRSRRWLRGKEERATPVPWNGSRAFGYVPLAYAVGPSW